MKRERRDRLAIAAVAALTALAAALRFYALGRACLWVDEVMTAVFVKSGPALILQFCLRDTGPLPLSYLFPLIVNPSGGSEFLLRLPDAVFGVLAIPLAAETAWRLSRSHVAAIAAAALLAVAAHHIEYSREARGYALLAFVSLLAFRFLIEALETGKRNWLFALAAASLFGHFVSYFYCFTQGGLAVYAAGWIILAVRGGEMSRSAAFSKAKPLAAAFIAPTAAFVPWMLIAIKAFHQYAAMHATAAAASPVGAWIGATIHAWLPGPRGSGFIAFALIVAGDFYFLPARRGLLTLLAVAPTALAAAAFSLSTAGHFLAPRYLIGSLPICAIAGGMGLAALGQGFAGWRTAQWREKGEQLNAVGAGIALLLFAANGWLQLRDYPKRALMQKEDWRAAAIFMERNFQAGDHIAPGPDLTIDCLRYYLPPSLALNMLTNSEGDGGRLGETLRAAALRGTRLWYVAPSKALERTPDMIRWLEQNFTLETELPGSDSPVAVYLGPKAGAPTIR